MTPEERALLNKLPVSTPVAGYLTRVSLWGQCVCDEDSCAGEDCSTDRYCALCHHLDPEWPCPAEEDADYPLLGRTQ